MKTTLLESEPEKIHQWCVQMRSGSLPQAAKMASAIYRLDYSQLDPATAQDIEDALYFSMTGVDRTKEPSLT